MVLLGQGLVLVVADRRHLVVSFPVFSALLLGLVLLVSCKIDNSMEFLCWLLVHATGCGSWDLQSSRTSAPHQSMSQPSELCSVTTRHHFHIHSVTQEFFTFLFSSDLQPVDSVL